MSLDSTTLQLRCRLTSLRIDIILLKMSGDDPQTLHQREIEALQVAVQLKAECAKVMQ